MLDKLHSGIRYRPAGCESDTNESLIYIKVSLNRYTDKTRLCIAQLTKMCAESYRNLTCISPRSIWVSTH